jgi:hypothetical protein
MAPSIENGGLLDTSAIDQNRASTRSLSDLLSARAGGGGPSVAPQLVTNAADDSIAGAMQAQQSKARNDAAAMSASVAQQQRAGGEAAGESQKEAEGANRQNANLLSALRGRDLATAQAQQQAEWRNTLGNIGVNLSNQKLIQGLVSGAGQGAAALASQLRGRGEPGATDMGDGSGGTGGGALGEDSVSSGAGEDTSGATDMGGGSDNGPDGGAIGEGHAHGGIIVDDDERARTHRFLRSLGKKAA